MRSSGAALSRTAHRCFAAAALAALFLLGQAATLAHLAVETHIRCPEHGEIIHSRRGPEAGGPAHLHVPPCVRGQPRAPGHEHEECLVVLHGRDRALVTSAPTVGASPPPVPRAPVALVESRRGPPTFVYRLAPKNSPPV